MNEKKTIFQGKIANAINYTEIAKNIIISIPLYYDKNGIWYRYNSEAFKYEITDEIDILNAINDELEMANITRNDVKSQLINALKMEARKNKPTELKDTQIQFKDTIIDLETDERIRVSPNYFTLNPINWEIGEKEDTPMMDKFITEWVGEEYKPTLFEWIAYHHIRNYPIHRVFILNGSGSNGKSTFIELMRKYLGTDNITAGDFKSIFENRFGTSVLYNKLGLFMPELDFSIIEKTGTFKSATGHDPLLIEFKNKGAFTFYNYAKVTISTNSIPITTDKTDGYHRRILIIDFPNKFKEKYDLLSRIPEKEFENLALKSIRIAKELLKKGSFTNEGTIEERKAKYEKISNPIATFLDENVTEAPDMYISKKEFNFELNKWLNKHRHRNLTNKEIHKVMSDIYQEGWRGDSDKDGKTTGRIWQGLYWKDKLPKINKKEEYVNDI